MDISYGFQSFQTIFMNLHSSLCSTFAWRKPDCTCPYMSNRATIFTLWELYLLLFGPQSVGVQYSGGVQWRVFAPEQVRSNAYNHFRTALGEGVVQSGIVHLALLDFRLYMREEDRDPNDPYLSGTIWVRSHCVYTGTDRQRVRSTFLAFPKRYDPGTNPCVPM